MLFDHSDQTHFADAGVLFQIGNGELAIKILFQIFEDPGKKRMKGLFFQLVHGEAAQKLVTFSHQMEKFIPVPGIDPFADGLQIRQKRGKVPDVIQRRAVQTQRGKNEDR